MKETNWEWVDINLLKTDGVNPNSMTKQERASLRSNLEKYGWNMPIITDMDYLIADGEQKWEVAKDDMKLKKVPILRKKLSDTDRRIIRQSMNKLRGAHDPDLDADELKKILANAEMEDLTNLITSSEQEILNIINAAEKDEKGLKGAEEVDKLGKLMIKCPKCQHRFQKKDN